MLAPAVRALEADHHVINARGTRRALALLHSRGSRFDLVIVVCLARKGGRSYAAGVGLVKALFKHAPWTPVLVIAHAQEDVRLTGGVLLSGVREPTSSARLPGSCRGARCDRRPPRPLPP